MKSGKGKSFERQVAEFFRRMGYKNIALDAKIKGKSGMWHEVDIVIFDTLQPSRICWACQCKAWQRPIGIKEVREWVETCRDISVPSLLVSASGFSSEAMQYARAKKVFVIDWQVVERLNDFFWTWKERADSLASESQRIIYYLNSMYHTELLQQAVDAVGKAPSELLANNPRVFLVLCFLMEIGRGKKFGDWWHFLSDGQTNANRVKEKISEDIEFLRKLSHSSKMDFSWMRRCNLSTLCQIFLYAWGSLREFTFIDQLSKRWLFLCRAAAFSKEGSSMADWKKREIERQKRLWNRFFDESRQNFMELNELAGYENYDYEADTIINEIIAGSAKYWLLDALTGFFHRAPSWGESCLFSREAAIINHICYFETTGTISPYLKGSYVWP